MRSPAGFPTVPPTAPTPAGAARLPDAVRGARISPEATHHRSLFLSDLHLGAKSARPDLILAFLRQNTADTVYLVGDIVDNWHPLAQNWTQEHHDVLHHLLALPAQGARVIYVPGNHDAFFRQYAGRMYEGIEVRLDAVHRAADGAQYLVVHGDCCDVFSRRAPILSRLGAMIETGVRSLDALQKAVTRRLDWRDWDGIERTISATNAMIRKHDRFEERLSDLARAGGYDGVICGHFHQASLRDIEGVTYANCGDWVGSNTAMVEGADGRLRLIGSPQAPHPSRRFDVAAEEGEHALAI
ncbi:UDP-2,3-diacylglucosamine diphosphatase [Aquimixticola soesokkakensis]|uniref:UDP-2,3-diacylglucosamine diphosphatase n=1 Tax=Aquimixticola soesokkakensis TaxID=1519096 RepID=UPI0013563A04|nr:UDP-2,3-diacylglucosamine diphosphatase [Aquimixticola soesokkakensis]